MNDSYRHNETSQVDVSLGPEFSRDSLISIIWQRRLIILMATLSCLGAAFIYILRARPIYTGTSRVYVEQCGPKIMTEEEGVMTQSKNYLYTQAELLKSMPILSDMMKKTGIDQMKTFANVDNSITYLKKHLNVTVGKKDDIINVSIDSAYPEEAAQMVNALVDSYITYHTTHKRGTAGEVLKLLRKEKETCNEEMRQKMEHLREFSRQNGSLSLGNDKDNIIVHRLGRLSDALTEAKLETIDARAAYDNINAMMSDPVKVRQLVEGRNAEGRYPFGNEHAKMRRQLTQLQTHLNELKRQGTADHPAVLATRGKIAQLQHQLTEQEYSFAQAWRTAAVQRWITSMKKEAQIKASLDEQQKLTLELNAKNTEYEILKSDLDRIEKLSESFHNRIKEINVTEDAGALNISILELARPADKPSEPRKGRIMGIALALGILLGIALALLCDWMDHRLRSAEEISAVLGVPVLGAVPSMLKEQTVVGRGMKVHFDSTSSVAEAYRVIRTAVHYGLPGDQAQTLLITSPGPGDGKTTLVSNLGISMAQAGERTIIIDADFRKPLQHKIFEVERVCGLSSVLSGTDTLDCAIEHTSVAGLDLLTCGPAVSNPSEMLSCSAFANAIKELREKYDRILIDSPPVMHVSDARILGAICDVTVMVLRAEKSTRKVSAQGRDGLLSVGANILGVVVNDVPRHRGRYSYYNGYGYYGYYGYYNQRYGDSSTTEEAKTAPLGSEVQLQPRIIKEIAYEPEDNTGNIKQKPKEEQTTDFNS